MVIANILSGCCSTVQNMADSPNMLIHFFIYIVTMFNFGCGISVSIAILKRKLIMHRIKEYNNYYCLD